MVLNTKVQGGRIIGTLTGPQHFEENGSGEFEGIRLPLQTRRVVGRWRGYLVDLDVGDKSNVDSMPMTLRDKDHASLLWAQGRVPAWKFERTPTDQVAMVAIDWPVYSLDPEIVTIRQQLRLMVEQDIAAREKKLIDPKQTDALSEQARPFLEDIYALYGWPKLSIFDARATNDFGLLVQHQPLALQERMLSALKTAVDAGEASKLNYVYLFDRVQVSEGKSQHWGTQSRCVRGRAVLYPADDAGHLEGLRKEAGLDRLADSVKQTDAICARVPQ